MALARQTRLVALPGREVITPREQVGEGAEGVVWRVGRARVAKLYHDKCLVAEKRLFLLRKIKMLIAIRGAARTGPMAGIVWPDALLFDDAGRFQGFLMPGVEGTPLHLVIKDRTWTLAERVEVARQLGRIVSGLHARGLAVGDLSPNNVLVSRVRRTLVVWLIDVDSLHLPGFPCGVTTGRYRLPAVLRKERAGAAGPEVDNHALAFLTFELLLGGVSPYAHKGGEDSEEENTAKQFFPFAEDARRVPEVPCPWLRRWEALPGNARDLFQQAFLRSSASRPPAAAWPALLSCTTFPTHWPDVTQWRPAPVSTLQVLRHLFTGRKTA
jgi:DNA-binding helix-hairpin-helix protein with protein kinase domain